MEDGSILNSEMKFGLLLTDDFRKIRESLHPQDAAHLLEVYRSHLMPMMLRAVIRQQEMVNPTDHLGLVLVQAQTSVILRMEALLAGLSKDIQVKKPGKSPE